VKKSKNGTRRTTYLNKKRLSEIAIGNQWEKNYRLIFIEKLTRLYQKIED
jgi:hypothetical protein